MSNHYPLHWRRLLGVALMLVVSASTMLAQWTPLKPLAGQLYYTQNAILNNKLYTFGGVGVPMAGGAVAQLSEARMLDLGAPGAVWSNLSPLPEVRYGGFAAAVNGKIYIMGGIQQSTIIGDVLEYNAATDTYVQKASMPTPLFYVAGAVIGTKIYIIGGASLNASNQIQNSPKVQVYDVTTDTWSTATNLPISIFLSTATAIGDDIYVVGGQNQSAAIYKSMYKGHVDGSSITWTTDAATNFPNFIYSAASGTLNGKVYVSGGVTQTGQSDQTYYFDPAVGEWTKTYPLPVATSNISNMPGDATALYHIGGNGTEKVLKLTAGADAPVATVTNPSVSITVVKGSSKTGMLEIMNGGSAPLNVSLSAPADAKWLTGEAITVEPFSTSSMTLTGDAATLAAGTFKTTATLTTNDQDHKTIPVTVRLYVLDQEVLTQPMHIVVEEASGAWCGPCGATGIPLLRQLKETYGESLITMTYHDRGGRGTTADLMATTETEGINAKIGVQYFPSAAISRWDFPYKQNNLSLLTGDWDRAISEILAKQPEAPMAIEVIDQKYDAATKMLTAKVRLTASQAISIPTGSGLRLTGVLLEDSLQYDQYLGTEDPYYHMHAARKFWPDMNGKTVTVPSTATEENGTILKPGSVLTVDVSMNASTVKVPAMGHIVFFAHLNKGTTFQQILQGYEGDLAGGETPTGPSIAVVTLVNSKTVNAEATGEFTAEVHNLTDSPVELSVTRTQNLPSGWSSQICIVDDCSPASQSTVLQSILPKATVTVKLKVATTSNGNKGTVSLKFASPDVEQTEDFTLNTTGSSGINDRVVATGGLQISNFPNPVTGATRFDYNLPKTGMVGIELFTLVGEKVMSLFSARQDAGIHSLNADLASLPNGVYTVVLSIDGTKVTRTITIAR